jgi:hypothetical protein
MADMTVLTPEFRRKLSTIRNPKHKFPVIQYTLMEQSICLIVNKSHILHQVDKEKHLYAVQVNNDPK